MIWNLAYTPQIWLPVFTALALIALAVYSYRRRDVPGALPFTFALLFGALWMVGSSLEIAAVAVPTKIFWIKFRVIWLVPMTTAVTCFFLEYAWPKRWLTRRNLVLLSIPCLLNVGMILTDNFHHLAWQGFMLDGEVTPLNGLGNWIFLVYVFVLGLSNLVVLAWLFIHSPQYRWPAALMFAGLLAVRVVYALGEVQVIHSNLPIEVIVFWFQIPMYAIALFGFRILNPVPLARQAVIDQMREGMLVLDQQGRVASLNRAAVAILGIPHKQACNLPLPEILPSCPPLLEGSLSEVEISLGTGPEARTYLLSTSSLQDWRGQEAGSLLLLHDITSRKQTEAALNETREIQRLIYEKSFDGISIYEELPDEDQRILVDCNERYCQMAGRSKAELLAIQDTRLIQWSEHLTEDSDRAAVMAERVFTGVFSWIRPDDKENVIEYNAALIRVGERFYTIGVDRDMTESRRTQAQILEQQRVVATLSERERLARELHDSLGQVLGFASLKLGATRKLVTDGKLEKADDQLANLESILSDAHADVREYILNLHTAPNNDQPFFATVRHYLDGFCQNFGIQVLLNVDEGLGQSPYPPEAQVPVFRILQEALSNARKHGQARCVQVSFAAEGGVVRMVVQDDGKGFDATQPAGEGHYGLRFIRERAEGLGGWFSADSAPGQGTRLVLEVPVHHV